MSSHAKGAGEGRVHIWVSKNLPLSKLPGSYRAFKPQPILCTDFKHSRDMYVLFQTSLSGRCPTELDKQSSRCCPGTD